MIQPKVDETGAQKVVYSVVIKKENLEYIQRLADVFGLTISDVMTAMITNFADKNEYTLPWFHRGNEMRGIKRPFVSYMLKHGHGHLLREYSCAYSQEEQHRIQDELKEIYAGFFEEWSESHDYVPNYISCFEEVKEVIMTMEHVRLTASKENANARRENNE